jgi:hypothetical protein
MKKRKPKLPSWAGAVRSPLGASKADAAQRLAAEDIAVERAKRRHALLSKLDVLRGLDEAEKRREDIAVERATGATSAEFEAARKAMRQPATWEWDAAKPLAHPVRERMELVPWDAVLAVAQTMTEGIKTHDEGAWRKLPQRDHVSRALRHLALFLVGDLAEPHLFHAACRTLMALETSESLPFREGEYDVEKD